MNSDDKEKKYGSSGINILWLIVSNSDYKTELSNVKEGKSPNNISPIIKYSLENGVTALWFGDLENTFMGKINSEQFHSGMLHHQSDEGADGGSQNAAAR